MFALFYFPPTLIPSSPHPFFPSSPHPIIPSSPSPFIPKKKGNNFRHSLFSFGSDIDYPNAKRINPVAVRSLSVDFMY